MRTWVKALPRLLCTTLLLFSVIASGCSKPTGSASAATAPVTTCTKVEQQCQYAEGKIGLCTASGMDCDGATTCLVCMSLH